jgi:hypothetical protein
VPWCSAVVQRLGVEKPDVIVLTNYLGRSSGTNSGAVRADWEHAATSMLARLPLPHRERLGCHFHRFRRRAGLRS